MFFRKPSVALAISIVVVVLSSLLMIARDEEPTSVVQQVPVETEAPALTETEPPAETETPSDTGGTISGDSFELSGLEITIGDTIGWTEVDAQWNDLHEETVFYLPVHVRNVSDETQNFFPWFRTFGPDGLEIQDEISWAFDDSATLMDGMRPGASQDLRIYTLYLGSGEYMLSFDNWDEWDAPNIDFVLQIQQ